MTLNNKKTFNILGLSLYKLSTYFMIYSFLGYIIETIFAIAVAIILFSKYFNKNKITLFLGGFIIGAITEYIISFLVEIIMQIRWWDYSNRILNINGRICILYSIFWGILTVLLIKRLNPKIDKMIDKIKEKISIKLLKLIA